MSKKTINATVDVELADKLDTYAKETHRKKSYFVNQALREYFEAIEDYEIALSRKDGETVTLAEAKRELGI